MGKTAASAKTTALQYASTESLIYSDGDPAYAAFDTPVGAAQGHQPLQGLQRWQRDEQQLGGELQLAHVPFGRRPLLNPSNKYLMDYACEQAWREDTRGRS